jgi:hypothetical protein
VAYSATKVTWSNTCLIASYLKNVDRFELIVLISGGQLPPLLYRDPCIKIVHHA